MACRGLIANAGGTRLYGVVGNQLVFVASDGSRTALGSLATRRGHVDMAIGRNQLVVVDGANGYVYNTNANTFSRIMVPGWLGSKRVGYLDGYFVFFDPGTQRFYISGVEDAGALNPLDFASAQGAPDNIVSLIVDHRELWLLGDSSGEVWNSTGASSFPLERNQGAFMQTGCIASFTLRRMDNTIFWLGQDETGGGIVFRAQGYRPARVSTEAVEQSIQGAIEAGHDISEAVAYAYQQNGHLFYVLQVPGLDTTWSFDASTGMWHERAEWVNGAYRQHRGRYHAYCYGRHMIGGDDGLIYAYTPSVNTNAGDVLVRERVSPHYAQPSQAPVVFGEFALDCIVGKGLGGSEEAQVLMRYSNDGGESWENWSSASLGARGNTAQRASWNRCGSSADRVWHVRCTDDVPFAIVRAKVEAR